jgi:hypothetical protein
MASDSEEDKPNFTDMDNTTLEYCFLSPFKKELIRLVSKLPIVNDDLVITKDQLAEAYTVAAYRKTWTNDRTLFRGAEYGTMINRVRQLRDKVNLILLSKIRLTEQFGNEDVFWRPGPTPLHTIHTEDVMTVCHELEKKREKQRQQERMTQIKEIKEQRSQEASPHTEHDNDDDPLENEQEYELENEHDDKQTHENEQEAEQNQENEDGQNNEGNQTTLEDKDTNIEEPTETPVEVSADDYIIEIHHLEVRSEKDNIRPEIPDMETPHLTIRAIGSSEEELEAILNQSRVRRSFTAPNLGSKRARGEQTPKGNRYSPEGQPSHQGN